MELFAKVRDVFTIEGRGVVVSIEFISQTGKIRVGDRAFLRNPSGSTHYTKVRGAEFACSPGTHYHPRMPCQVGLMLGTELSKESIELNAEIFIFPEEQALRKSMKSQTKSD